MNRNVKYIKYPSILFTMIFLLLSLLILPGCPAKNEIAAKLTLSESPVLGKPVEVTFTFAIQEDYPHDAKNATARIILPEGFELVKGNLEWQGDVLRGNTYSIQATIKAIKTGYWKLEGRTRYSPSPSSIRATGDDLYVGVFEDRGEVSESPLHRVNYTEPVHDSESPKTTSLIIPSGAKVPKSELPLSKLGGIQWSLL